MATVHITKGHNIKISGAPEKRVVNLPCPSLIKIIPDNFRTVKPKLLVKEGDQVKIGDKLFFDKNNPSIFFCSHVSGNIQSIKLGNRRKVEGKHRKGKFGGTKSKFGGTNGGCLGEPMEDVSGNQSGRAT